MGRESGCRFVKTGVVLLAAQKLLVCHMLRLLQVVTKLHAILRPFLLRRVKSDVETDLPAKKEIILYAGMTDVQRKLHSELREKPLAVRPCLPAGVAAMPRLQDTQSASTAAIGVQHRLCLETQSTAADRLHTCNLSATDLSPCLCAAGCNGLHVQEAGGRGRQRGQAEQRAHADAQGVQPPRPHHRRL